MCDDDDWLLQVSTSDMTVRGYGDPSLRVYDGTAWGKTATVAIPPQYNRPTSVTEEQFAAGVEALIAAQRQRHETPAGQLRAALSAMHIGAPA